MKNVSISVCFFLLVSGCATPQQNSYVPPTAGKYANTTEMPYGVDEAWKRLVRAASGTFFAIENFEKDSGLMTLSFSTDSVNAIDCGTMNGVPYTTWFRRPENQTSDVNVQGKMNLLVEEIDANTTLVSVNARYIVNMSASGYVYNWITSQNQFFQTSLNMNFDSNGMGSDNVSTAAPGTSSYRACAPTGEVENTVLRAIADA